jgi:hypothetical protein
VHACLVRQHLLAQVSHSPAIPDHHTDISQEALGAHPGSVVS